MTAQIFYMSYQDYSRICRDCIRSLQHLAQGAGQQSSRKVEHITLRHYFIHGRVCISVRQKDKDGVTRLHFLCLVNEETAVPIYMYQLLEDDFPYAVPAFPDKQTAADMAIAFSRWYRLVMDAPLSHEVYHDLGE